MAFSLIASASAGSTGGTSVTTSGVNTTGASLLVMIMNTAGGKTDVPSDSKSNSWTKLTTSNKGSVQCTIAYVVNPTVGASHTFTDNPGGSSYPNIVVYAFGGAKTTSPFDQQNGAITGSTTTTLATGSVTASEDNELYVCGIALDGPYSALSIDSSFATPIAVAFSSANHYGGGASYFIQTSAAAENPSFSWGGAVSAAARIATFKSAPAASGNLFRVPTLAGLGSGGPFFQNPLS